MLKSGSTSEQSGRIEISALTALEQASAATPPTQDIDGPMYMVFSRDSTSEDGGNESGQDFSDDEEFFDKKIQLQLEEEQNEEEQIEEEVIDKRTISLKSLESMRGEAVAQKKRSWKTNKHFKRSIIALRLLSLFPILYFFVCSLDLLTSGFQLLAGKAAGQLFKEGDLLTNPIAGLMIGVLVTILVQSSSTTTSIIVSMVSAGILDVEYSIPMIMGANVGTSVTNTLVSFGQVGNVNEFKRAFAGATIHDAFNWLNVLVQLPLEVGTGFLYKMTSAIVKNMNSSSSGGDQPQFLNVITDPLTDSIIQINWTVVEAIAQGKNITEDDRLMKTYCSTKNETNSTTGEIYVVQVPCTYLMTKLSCWPDSGVGILLTVISLIILTICLMLLVNTLRHLLEGKISKILRKTVDKNFPGIFRYLTPYVFILAGMGLTILVQSSSVFTSAVTPLVGSGVISLKRMYPLTLGSNVGTTVTAIISALAAPTVEKFRDSMQAALCHLFFNIFGIIIFFVIIPLRKLPMETAKFFGRETSKYRWFAILYLLVAFVVFPGLMLGLSIAGTPYAIAGLVIIVVAVVVIVTIRVLQKRQPKYLPRKLRTWKWLPEPLRSLAPYDRFFTRVHLSLKSTVIRPNISVTSMTQLFRHKNMSSDTLA